MSLSYVMRADGKQRAGVAIWTHPTEEQVEKLQQFADRYGVDSWRTLVRKMTEKAIEDAIANDGKDLPYDRDEWEHTKV